MPTLNLSPPPPPARFIHRKSRGSLSSQESPRTLIAIPKSVLPRRLGKASAAWKLTGSQRPTNAPRTRRSLPRRAAERRRVRALLACPRLCRRASRSTYRLHAAVEPSSARVPGYLAASRPGRAAITPPLASAAARSGPPYSTECLAGPSLSVHTSPIRSTVFLSNRFESPGRGWSLGNHRGEAEGRSENDQSETSSSPYRPASSDCRESAGSFTAARGWGPLGEEKEATNQPSRPHPLPPPPPTADLVYGLERRLQCGS